MFGDSDDLFASAGVDLPPDPPSDEEIAGKLSNSVFRPWYKQFYEGRYIQKESHIAMVLRDFVLKVVVQGTEELSTVKLAMYNLGSRQTTITPLALQYALGQAKAELIKLRNTGVVDSAANSAFEDFMVHGLPAGSYDDSDRGIAPVNEQYDPNALLNSMDQYDQSSNRRNDGKMVDNEKDDYDDVPF